MGITPHIRPRPPSKHCDTALQTRRLLGGSESLLLSKVTNHIAESTLSCGDLKRCYCEGHLRRFSHYVRPRVYARPSLLQCCPLEKMATFERLETPPASKVARYMAEKALSIKIISAFAARIARRESRSMAALLSCGCPSIAPTLLSR